MLLTNLFPLYRVNTIHSFASSSASFFLRAVVSIAYDGHGCLLRAQDHHHCPFFPQFHSVSAPGGTQTPLLRPNKMGINAGHLKITFQLTFTQILISLVKNSFFIQSCGCKFFLVELIQKPPFGWTLFHWQNLFLLLNLQNGSQDCYLSAQTNLWKLDNVWGCPNASFKTSPSMVGPWSKEIYVYLGWVMRHANFSRSICSFHNASWSFENNLINTFNSFKDIQRFKFYNYGSFS